MPTGELPDGITMVDETGVRNEPANAFDFVHLFVSSVKELGERAPAALAAVKYDGLLWISYPKKSGKIKTDIHRDVGPSNRSAGSKSRHGRKSMAAFRFL